MKRRRTLSSFILHPSSFRSGFSLTEVMFAVIILGIGFILVAAIFPVTISQSRMTVEETTAAATGRAAMAQSSTLAAGGDSPPPGTIPPTWGPLLPPTDLYDAAAFGQRGAAGTLATGGAPFTIPPNLYPYAGGAPQVTVPGKVLSFNDDRLDDGTSGGPNYKQNLWNAFKGSLAVPSDTRYAWVPLYRRDMTYFNRGSSALQVPLGMTSTDLVRIPAPYAQIYFIPVAVRNRSNYDVNDINVGTGNFVARRLLARVVPEPTASTGYAIAFDDLPVPPNVSRNALESVADGAFVVISDDKFNGPATDQGLFNGHIYRVGIRRPDLDGTGNGLYVNQFNGNANMQVWELAPGSEFKGDNGANGLPGDLDDILAIGNDASLTNEIRTRLQVTGPPRPATASGPAEVLVIGRNPIVTVPPPNPQTYEGVSQDVSAFVTFIKVN